MGRHDVYRRWKKSREAAGIRCTLTFAQWCDLWDEKPGAYEARGRGGWVTAQSVIGDGFVPGNVEIIPATEVFRRTMDEHYGGERDYLP